MSEISTSVTAFARSQANSIGHGTGYANAPSALACATARSAAAPRPSRGPGSACFGIFSSKLGCLGSILVSIVGTLLLLVLEHVV